KTAGKQRIDQHEAGDRLRCRFADREAGAERQPVEFVEEEELQRHAEPEHRDAGADHGHQPDGAVDRATRFAGGEHGQRKARREIDDEADQQQFERRRQILGKVGAHAAAGADGEAEIALRQPAHVG
ncbi:hypothetical protein D0U04_30970, partial [Bacillus clarus]